MNHKNKYIAVDIGGTNTRIALFIEDKISIVEKIKTNIDSFELHFENIAKIVNKFNQNLDVKGIGISAPGPSDYKKGIFLNLPNIPKWTNYNFKKFLEEKTNIKEIVSDNDANLMALAHHNYFQNYDGITQFFTISTGLGAGLIIGNKIFHGTNDFAQEIALAPVSWKKESGKSLSEGALELFSSGSGLKERSGVDPAELLKEKKNPVVREGIEALGNIIAITLSIINPNLMVFDGSVARNNHYYIEEAIKLAKTRSFEGQFNSCTFKHSKLKDDAALIGAFYLIKNNKK